MTRAFREQPQSLSRAHRPADTAAALQALSIPEAAESLLRMPIADAVGALDRPEFANAAKVLALLSPGRWSQILAAISSPTNRLSNETRGERQVALRRERPGDP